MYSVVKEYNNPKFINLSINSWASSIMANVLCRRQSYPGSILGSSNSDEYLKINQNE